MKIDSAIKRVSDIIELWIPQKMKCEDVPGMSIGIFFKGKLLYQKGFGYFDVQKKRRMRPDDLYRVASMSKMFTATAILQLQEQSKLKLNDRVSKYLPWFKGKNRVGDLSKITLRQVLSHTSGLFRDGEKPYWFSHKFPKKLNDTISDRAIIFKNSKRFKYSNHGYALLGDVIKTVSGQTYSEYIQENILNLLGMRSTYPDLEKKALSRLARGYGRVLPEKKRKQEAFPNVPTYAYAPATGFISNVGDLARFLNSLILRSSGPQILSEKSKRMMTKLWTKTSKTSYYGLGLSITKAGRRKYVGHGGGFAGYVTQSLINPQDKCGVIVLSNSLENQSYNISRGIFDTLYYFTDKRIRKNAATYPYTGVYRDRWGDMVIASADNSLISFGVKTNNPVSNDKILLRPIGKHSFRLEMEDGFGSPGELVVFSLFKNGKAQKLLWSSNPMIRIS